METIGSRLGYDLFNAITEQRGSDGLVATNVVEGNIAKRALASVATMGKSQLVPAAIAP